jgi:hypothetical protein
MSSKGLNLAAAIFALAATGCATRDFSKPVSEFTGAMGQANGIIGGYFRGMNAFERDLYLRQVALDPRIDLASVDAAGRPTGLLPRFSAESVKARLDAVRLLSAYGERLAALAGSDAPARFQAGSKVLGENLTSLSQTFHGLAGSGDRTAGQYVGPISTIVGTIGEMVLERRREAAPPR